MDGERARDARERSKRAHLRAADTYFRAAKHYEMLARTHEEWGNDQRASELRAKVKASRLNAFEQRVMAIEEDVP